jgi:hypothetical protein
MIEIPTIAVWTFRYSDLQVRCIESVARHTFGSYNLMLVCEPGNCHVNMQRVLDRNTSRYLCFLDEDVEILQPGWLDVLIADLEDYPDVGVVGCREFKDKKDRDELVQLGGPIAMTLENPLNFRTWIAAYVMVFDMERCAGIEVDQNIPGHKGMTDVDLCFQVRAKDLKVARDERIVVYHPFKNRAEQARYDLPDEEVVLGWFPAQREYMKKKWSVTAI